MTVVAIDARGRFDVDVSRESLDKTAGLDATGEVNLEKALRAARPARRPSRLRPRRRRRRGHAFRAGRRIARAARAGAARRSARFLALQGLDHGQRRQPDRQPVDDRADGCEFSINLIPHTVEVTTLRGSRAAAGQSRDRPDRALRRAHAARRITHQRRAPGPATPGAGSGALPRSAGSCMHRFTSVARAHGASPAAKRPMPSGRGALHSRVA